MLDVAALGPAPEARARAPTAAGADWIQQRDRSGETGLLLEKTRSLVRARDARLRATAEAPPPHDPLARPRPRVIVNRRVDVARASGADGVHLGFDALVATSARAILDLGAPRRAAAARRAQAGRALDAPEWRPIGRSLHAAAEVADAATAGGVDYVHLAPIWDPISKPATRAALGLEELAHACRHGLPVLAQGGLDAIRAGDEIRAGAAGIALTGAIAAPEVPAETLQPIREALDEAAASP